MEEYVLNFEAPLAELDKKIREMNKFAEAQHVDLTGPIQKLHEERSKLAEKIFSNLNAWQIVELARHPLRPQAHDYVRMLCSDFVPLYGDKLYHEDQAIMCGFCTIDDLKFMLVAHRKGKNTEERKACNWGMPHPEGFRKAYQKMQLAEKFGLPIVTFIDTPGAFPGIGAEERGQSVAIANNLYLMSRLRTPIVSAVIGEGGSGGALGISVGDVLGIMQYAYYSVITPEGCASILWRDKSINCADHREDAATALKLTSKDLIKLKILDEIIPDPVGGAHRDPEAAAESLKKFLVKHLSDLKNKPIDELLEKRYHKLANIGRWAVKEDNSEIIPQNKNQTKETNKVNSESKESNPEEEQSEEKALNK